MRGQNLYWRQANDERLPVIAAAAIERGLDGYAEYCRLRALGLRPQALDAVRGFVAQAAGWPLTRRAEAIDWILTLDLQEDGVTDLIPRPLQTGLIDPTLTEWARLSPTDPRPWRWMPPPAGPRHALTLDPADQVARRRLAEFVLRGLEHATHELPWGYQGEEDLEEDLAFAAEGLTAAEGLKHPEIQAKLTGRLGEIRELIASYRDYRASGTGETFEAWAQANGRPFT